MRKRDSLVASLPFGLLVLGVFIIPTVLIFAKAFEAEGGVWSQLTRSTTIQTFQRTLLIALQVTLLCIFIGIPYAVALRRARKIWRFVLLWAVVLPFLTSFLVRTYAWIVLLGNDGPVNDVLAFIGGEAARSQLLYNRTAILISMVHALLPVFILPTYAALRQVPPELRQAARTLGADRITSLLTTELRLATPGVAAGALLTFVTALGFYVTPALLGGDGDTTVPLLIDQQLRFANLGEASALAMVLVVAIILCLLAFRLVYPLELLLLPGRRELMISHRGRGKSSDRVMRVHLRRAAMRVTSQLARAPWRAIVNCFAAVLVGYFVLPLAVVIPVSFIGEPYLHFPPDTLSLRWYRSVSQDPLWRTAAINSLAVGVTATFIATFAGLPLAFALARSRISARVKGLVVLVSLLPAIVPPIVLSVGIFVWYLDVQVVGNPLALSAAHAVLGLPFIVVIATAALRDFDMRTEQAARTLGASQLRAIKTITIPIVSSAIAGALLFAFLQSFDELLIARSVAGSNGTTLPMAMWNGARQEVSPALAVVSVASILVTVLCVSVAMRAVRRRSRGAAVAR